MSVVALLSTVLFLAVPVVVIVLVARAVAGRRDARPGEGHGVRRFFQYLLMLGLLVVTLVGLTTLLGLPFRSLVVGGSDALARGLTFTVVGGGLFALLVVWTRSLARSDPGELASIAWTVYLTIAGLVLGIGTAAYLGQAVSGLVADGRPEADPWIGTVVWGVAWAVHWLLTARTLDGDHASVLMVLGSLAGWAVGLTGLIMLMGQTLRLLVTSASLIGPTSSGLQAGAGVLAAGAVLWVPHWWRRFAKAPAGPVWHGYVLVVGVGISTVITLSGASVALDRVLVWLVGDPAMDAPAYVLTVMPAIAAALGGALSWWYHRAVHATRATPGRSEVTRIHEYLLAGVALLAAAWGVALVVVALIDALAPAPFAGGSVINSVLAAVTLLVVGGPLWWFFWGRVRKARAAEPATEAASPTRRIYLVLLFGVAGVVAVVAVLVAAFVVLQDAISGDLGQGTVRDLRIPLGILLSAGAISGYHAMVQREDRADAPAPVAHLGPRLVLLVGPRDDALAAGVHGLTGGRVDGWFEPGPPWDHDAVLAAVAAAAGPRLMLLSEPSGLRSVSGAYAGQGGDQPGGRGEQGQAQLDEHAQPGRLQGEPGGVAGSDGVA